MSSTFDKALLLKEKIDLKKRVAEYRHICFEVQTLTNLIMGSPPETPIKGEIESQAFSLAHYDHVMNAGPPS